MKIYFIKSIWGMTGVSLEEKIKMILDARYDGVEMNTPELDSEQDEFGNLLVKYPLKFVAQQWTTGRTHEDHKQSFRKQFLNNVRFKPIVINSHTGRDYFSHKENVKIIEYSYLLAESYKTRLTHETHRGRFPFHPMITSEYLNRSERLNLTADFSHWCCVSESLLEDQEEYLSQSIQRSLHIHARVGHQQWPQVSDPRAPEWKEQVKLHCLWWKRIIEFQKAKHTDYITVTPEFGPPNYLQTQPYTGEPAGDIWAINLYMKELLQKYFSFT